MSVSRRAYRLHHARGQVSTPGSIGATRSSPGSASSVFGKTVMNGDMGMGGDEDDEDHLMLCDSCEQSIVGARYQCLSCPGKPISYNLVSLPSSRPLMPMLVTFCLVVLTIILSLCDVVSVS